MGSPTTPLKDYPPPPPPTPQVLRLLRDKEAYTSGCLRAERNRGHPGSSQIRPSSRSTPLACLGHSKGGVMGS